MDLKQFRYRKIGGSYYANQRIDKKKVSNLFDRGPHTCRYAQLYSFHAGRHTLHIIKKRGQLILLCGAGGTGKTFMARRLFYRLQNNYTRFAWIKYGTDMRTSLLSAFNDFNTRETGDRFSKIVRELTKEPSKTILFIDDVKEDASKDDVLSRITGLGITVFLTSRCERIPPYEVHKIAALSTEECVELFYSYCTYDLNRQYSKTVQKLAHLLHNHAMLIILLAQLIGDGTTLEKYYRRLRANVRPCLKNGNGLC